jgi:heme/copper-type cytochrome/quinol oxidase subunit 3
VSRRREATPASVPAVRRGDALDVANLPSYGFSHRSLMWWGTAGMIAIEGIAFGFMVIIYFYFRALDPGWPRGGNGGPDLFWGSLNAVLIVVSAIPNTVAERAAMNRDLPRVRMGLVGLSLVSLALCVVRWMEFTRLNVGFADSAYGSTVWTLLGLHTFNLVTDVADTLVLTVLMYKGPLEGKRFVDIAENSGYWDFIVLTWLPIYAVIYWAPKF